MEIRVDIKTIDYQILERFNQSGPGQKRCFTAGYVPIFLNRKALRMMGDPQVIYPYFDHSAEARHCAEIGKRIPQVLLRGCKPARKPERTVRTHRRPPTNA